MKKRKEERLSFRLTPKDKEDFLAVAELANCDAADVLRKAVRDFIRKSKVVT